MLWAWLFMGVAIIRQIILKSVVGNVTELENRSSKMAGADYYSCDECSCKTFYDAEVEYWNVGQMIVLCPGCSRKYEIVILEREQEQQREH